MPGFFRKYPKSPIFGLNMVYNYVIWWYMGSSIFLRHRKSTLKISITVYYTKIYIKYGKIGQISIFSKMTDFGHFMGVFDNVRGHNSTKCGPRPPDQTSQGWVMTQRVPENFLSPFHVWGICYHFGVCRGLRAKIHLNYSE